MNIGSMGEMGYLEPMDSLLTPAAPNAASLGLGPGSGFSSKCDFRVCRQVSCLGHCLQGSCHSMGLTRTPEYPHQRTQTPL